MKLILASRSPRRKQILSRLKISFSIIAADVDESQFSSNQNPEVFACELAELKASYVGRQYPDSLVIGADTIVVLHDEIMGKPDDKQDAGRMLKKLSGNTHRVITAVSLVHNSKTINHTFFQDTKVTFHDLSREDISTYIDSTSPYDKAGSYGIQDWSAIFVEHINGCYDNVVGFPLSRFYCELKKIGIQLNEIS